jgi:CheY-like chemotaxis protein
MGEGGRSTAYCVHNEIEHRRGRARLSASRQRLLRALRSVAAGFGSVPFAFCTRPTVQAVVTIRSKPEEEGVPHGSAIEAPKPQTQTGTENPRHVLVVDDDAMVCMAIEIYLQRNNFRVTIAEGGEAGLRALENEHFDLMIIDIFMPHMRGFESIRLFHERAPAIPLIAMSGYAFANLNSPAPDFLRMALELGAARCLRKPFTPDALLAAITDCLAEHRAAAMRLG